MLKVVREYQEVVTEYLVEANSDEEAIYLVSKGDEKSVEIDIVPTFVGILRREVREITQKDRKDPVFRSAEDELTYKEDLYEDQDDLQTLLEMCRD